MMLARSTIWMLLAGCLTLIAAAGLVVTYLIQQPGDSAPGEPPPVSNAHTGAAAAGAPAPEAHHHENALAEVLLATVRDLGIEPESLTDGELAQQAAAVALELDRPLLPAGQCDQLDHVPPTEQSDAVVAALRVCDSLPETP